MLHPDIAENERQRRVLKFKATRDALRVERDCAHSVIAYRKGYFNRWGGSLGVGVCICLACRMEYHIEPHVDPKTHETLERRFVTPQVAGVTEVYHLRVKDSRPFLTQRYGARPPSRKTLKERKQ